MKKYTVTIVRDSLRYQETHQAESAGSAMKEAFEKCHLPYTPYGVVDANLGRDNLHMRLDDLGNEFARAEEVQS